MPGPAAAAVQPKKCSFFQKLGGCRASASAAAIVPHSAGFQPASEEAAPQSPAQATPQTPAPQTPAAQAPAPQTPGQTPAQPGSQAAPQLPAPTPAQNDAQKNGDQPYILPTVRVNLVNLVFTVTDKDGHFKKDLKRENFGLLDNGRPPAAVIAFTQQTNLPLRIGIMLDTSSSIRTRFKFEQDSAVDFFLRAAEAGRSRLRRGIRYPDGADAGLHRQHRPAEPGHPQAAPGRRHGAI